MVEVWQELMEKEVIYMYVLRGGNKIKSSSGSLFCGIIIIIIIVNVRKYRLVPRRNQPRTRTSSQRDQQRCCRRQIDRVIIDRARMTRTIQLLKRFFCCQLLAIGFGHLIARRFGNISTDIQAMMEYQLSDCGQQTKAILGSRTRHTCRVARKYYVRIIVVEVLLFIRSFFYP